MMLFSYSSCSQSKGGEPCWGHKMNWSGCEMLTERGNAFCLPQCVDVLVTHLLSAFSLSLLCSSIDKSETYSLWQVFISRYWFICVYMDKPGSIPYLFPLSSNPMSRPNQQCTNPSLNTLWFRYPLWGSQLQVCWLLLKIDYFFFLNVWNTCFRFEKKRLSHFPEQLDTVIFNKTVLKEGD